MENYNLKDYIVKFQGIDLALFNLREAGYTIIDDAYTALIIERALLEKNYAILKKELNLL